MVGIPCRQHGLWRDFLSRAGSDRRLDHRALRIHQRALGDSVRQRDHFCGEFADQLLRRQVRRRYGFAHARRRLRLYRLDHHLADLCVVHVYLLRPGSGHHGAGAAALLQDPDFAELSDLCGHRDPLRHSRHHPDQPAASVHSTAMDRLAVAALRCRDLEGARTAAGITELYRQWRQRRTFRPADVRLGQHGADLDDCASRRAGRLLALPARANRTQQAPLDHQHAYRRPRLDSPWGGETARRRVSRFSRDPA